MTIDTNYLREDEREWLEVARATGDQAFTFVALMFDRLIEERKKNEDCRDALRAIADRDLFKMQAVLDGNMKSDMILQGDYQHDARYAYPLQMKAVRKIANNALGVPQNR